MGILDKLTESIFKVRVIPKQDPSKLTNFTDEKNSAIQKINDAIETGRRIDLSDLMNITTLKGTRNQKYSVFEDMVADGRIGAAVEMYANDTVQYNQEGKVIWAESNDTDVATYVNKLLSDLNIAENLWSYAYCMWLYGDVYLETFANTSNDGSRPTLLLEPSKANFNVKTQVPIRGTKLERYIEKVANPAEIYDLQYRGKTSGFVRSHDEIENTLDNNTYLYTGVSTDITILNPTKFVHICLSPNINRFPEKFRLIKEDPKKLNDATIDGSDSESINGQLSFTVKTGQSILENVYGPYQTLKLKEESVLLERVTKSSITRVIQVELGDLPESQKVKKLREIKNQIEQQLIMNKEAGTLQSRAGAQPIENIIYTTTKNGKGAISTVNIGGDAQIGDLDDITQSENKMFGALLTPKAALGADMDGTGLSNGGSLTELNTTYARRIKRGQVAICAGIKNLVNIFALGDGLGSQVVNNFEIKLTPIITVEDNRRDELLQTKIRNVNDILSLLNNIDSIDETTKLDMIIEWLGKYLNQQEIVDILNERIEELEKEEKDKDKQEYEDKVNDEIGDANDFDFEGGDEVESNPFKNSDIASNDFDETEDDNISDESNENNNEPNQPELAPQTNLADIEGEDLV